MKDSVLYQFNSSKKERHLSLLDISNNTPYSLNYLILMAQSGKLKAFKIGEYWYSSLEWLDLFINNLKNEIEKEAPETEECRWTNYLSGSRKKDKWFNYFLTAIVSIFIYVWLIIFFLRSFG